MVGDPVEHETQQILSDAARRFGTPSFIYFAPAVRARVELLRQQFGGRFHIIYAAKANPNTELLKLFQQMRVGLDVSSIGEMRRGLAAGFAGSEIGFTGPGKRSEEIEAAVAGRVGAFICESPEEIDQIDQFSRGMNRVQPILLRINPRHVPRKFGLHMAGAPSQFGIDEEDLEDVWSQMPQWKNVRFSGFHAYSAGNSLSVEAITENLLLLADIFTTFSYEFRLKPEKLIFGSGFGIPYFEGDKELDLPQIAAVLSPRIDAIKAEEPFRETTFALEMGRWLVGGAGFMLTSVVRCKRSRGKEIRICDAGFNNHLSAAGMMGTVLRRDWRFWNLDADDGAPVEEYLLVGPLCASFDILGANVALPGTSQGDVLAVGASGAYGLTASPTRFISHPEPGEYLSDVIDGEQCLIDVTESRMNAYQVRRLDHDG